MGSHNWYHFQLLCRKRIISWLL